MRIKAIVNGTIKAGSKSGRNRSAKGGSATPRTTPSAMTAVARSPARSRRRSKGVDTVFKLSPPYSARFWPRPHVPYAGSVSV